MGEITVTLKVSEVQNLITGSKRAGWDEGKTVAINALSSDYQGLGVEDKLYVSALGARIFAIPNPYGEAEPEPSS